MNFPQLLYVVVCCAYQAIATLMHKISLKQKKFFFVIGIIFVSKLPPESLCENMSINLHSRASLL